MGGGWEGLGKTKKEVSAMENRVCFWIVESRNRGKEFMWLFEETIDLERLSSVADRVDKIAVTAKDFYRENPPTKEEIIFLQLLLGEVKTQKAKVLLAGLL